MYCYFGPYSIEIEKEEIDLSPPEQYGPFSYEDMRLIVRRTLERIEKRGRKVVLSLDRVISWV
jgi:hypothetical protein